MKQITSIINWGYVTILALLPFHAFLSTWLGTAIGPLLLWKSWKEALLVILAPLIATLLFKRRDIMSILWSRIINKLIFVYVLLSLLFTFATKASPDAAIAGLAMNLRFFAMFVLAQILVELGGTFIDRVKNKLALTLLVVSLILSFLAVVQVTILPNDFLVQFGYNKDSTIAPYILVDENPDLLRAFATMRGPNTLGAYLILPLMVAAILILKHRKKVVGYLTIILGSIAVLLTGSRSALLGLLAGFCTTFLTLLPKEKLAKWVKWGALPVVLLIVLLGYLATTVPTLRLAIFHSSPGDPSLLEGSTNKHFEATLEGKKDVIKHPLGQGIGTAGPASFYNTNDVPKISENYFVQLAQEIGVIGLGIFIAINALLFKRLWQRKTEFWPSVLLASFAGLTVVNLFLHGWADDPTAMTFWAIAGLFAFSSKSKVNKIK